MTDIALKCLAIQCNILLIKQLSTLILEQLRKTIKSFTTISVHFITSLNYKNILIATYEIKKVKHF